MCSSSRSATSNGGPTPGSPSSAPVRPRTSTTVTPTATKSYDYLLKFLLVGDSDVGKQEILSGLEDGASESPFCSTSGKNT